MGLGGNVMKFQVEHDTLADAVAWVARALPSRPVVPVLSGLRLDAGDDGLTLSCFDYELSATAWLPAEVAEPGTALVPGRLLAEIIRSLPGEPAEFRSDGDEVTLSCGSAEFALVSLPTAEYPELPPAPPLAGTVDGGELATAVAQVLPATSRDDTLPMLTAVCLDIRGAVMTLAATDRYRLAVRDLGWQPASPRVRAIALVPARTLADAARVMAPGVPVSLAFSPAEDGGAPGRGGDPRPVEGMISFSSGGRRLTGRLIAGEFIKYESRFPAGYGCVAEMPAASLIEAVRRVSLVADRTSPVRLTFEQGTVALEAQTEGRARAVERVTASFHGDEPAIAFNPHYLLDGLAAAAAGSGQARNQAPTGSEGRDGAGEQVSAAVTIRLEFTSPAKPALITLAGGTDGTARQAGEEADAAPGEADSGADGATGTPASGPAAPRPGFRYLVVPLRSPARS
jgi:DNA polymerase-3 subunit beta